MRTHLSRILRVLDCACYFKRTGRFQKAAELFQQVLRLDPNQPEALYHLGVFARETGQLEDAVQLLILSLRVNSNHVGALSELAGVLKEQQRFPEALEFYQAALALSPNDAELHLDLGVVFTEVQRHPEATDCFQRALELNPNLKAEFKSEPLHANFCAALFRAGRLPEPIAHWWREVELDPKSFPALNHLGNAFGEALQYSRAVLYLKKALELKPDCVHTLNSLGAALKELGRFDEALACFHTALGFYQGQEPGIFSQIHRNRATAYYAAGRAGESVDCFRKSLELNPDCAVTFSDYLFVLNHLQSLTAEELFAEHRKFGKRFDSLLELKPHANTPDRERRLRVGFVSGDFRDHALAYFFEPVLVNMTKSRFEIFCYQNHPVNDAVSERFKNYADSWSNVDQLSDDDLAKRIRRDRIDILVDLSGHTARNRLLVFARKPAPVQVTMIGYMQTTGLAAMDYRITETALDPVGATDHLSTEKLIRLPAGAAQFVPPRDCPAVNALPAFRNGYVTFASFNKPSKITEEVLATWVRLLKATPGSRLLVVGLDCNWVSATMAAHGVEPARLSFFGLMPTREYLALHHQIDFCLDTFPYNGGTTSLFALWMGVPFVSLDGDTMISRVGGTLLKAVGLSELIAANPEEYVQKAAASVRNLSQLAERRGVLRSRLSACVGDGSSFTKQLEQAFLAMWREWCDTHVAVKLAEENSRTKSPAPELAVLPESESFCQYACVNSVTNQTESFSGDPS